MRFFLLCILCLLVTSKGQSQSDLSWHTQEFNIPQNRYGPFHQRIKDTADKTVSDIGHYGSLGLGESTYGPCMLLSYSLAYKSHIVTITGAGANYYSDYYNQKQAAYIGLLVGESLRTERLLFSVSAGIADTYINYTDLLSTHYAVNTFFYRPNNFSFPVEMKLLFLTSKSHVGWGFHFSGDALCLSQYISVSYFSPYFFSVCFVAGRWNDFLKK